MELIILLIIIAIIYFILRFVFEFNIKKIKQIGENEELDKLTEKYPQNIEICKYYLKKLNNQDVNIEENKNANSTLYLVMSNKVYIGNLKDSYTRIQTIAHECLHSIQSKKLLWFNFIFSNIYLVYFIVISILAIFRILPHEMLFLNILMLFGFSFYSVRAYLENDAMTKARFLAKEYMEQSNISTKEEIDKIVSGFDELNDIGIRCTNFQLFSNAILKVVIFTLICVIF